MALGRDSSNTLLKSLLGKKRGNLLALPTKVQTRNIRILLKSAYLIDLKRASGGDPQKETECDCAVSVQVLNSLLPEGVRITKSDRSLASSSPLKPAGARLLGDVVVSRDLLWSTRVKCIQNLISWASSMCTVQMIIQSWKGLDHGKCNRAHTPALWQSIRCMKTKTACRYIIATVGLGVSDFGYRISVSLVSCIDLEHVFGLDAWILCMDSVHTHGHCKEKQETVYHEECINTAFCNAIALQSIHFLQSHCIVFRPPTPACIYI